MFSVDNFYEVFNSYYCWPEKNNITVIFNPHGSKNWDTIIGYGRGLSLENHGFFTQHDPYKLNAGGVIVMHDQEPLSLSTLEYYKNKNDMQGLPPNVVANLLDRSSVSDLLTATDFIHIRTRTLKFPVVCHSELNSDDVVELEQNNIPTCYYWWHGMVARDWFRHQKLDNNFKVINKSDSEFRFLIYSRAFDGSRTYRTSVIDHLSQYRSMINYNWDQAERSPTLSAHIDHCDANNSAVHIVAETLFDTDKIYLTEKIFKPMVMSQPFIIFGPPGSLQYLRNYGFQTFDSCWDESYDLEQDHTARKNEIFKLIDQLANMSSQEFGTLYNKLLSIIEHNRNHFYSEKFQEILWAELQRNMATALSKQTELANRYPQGAYIKTVGEFAEQHGFIIETWKNNILNAIKENPLLEQRISQYHNTLFKLLKQN